MTDPGVTDPAPAAESRPPTSRSTGRSGGGGRVLGIVAALVVGVLIGGVIGWQVEKRRVQDDVKKVKAAARTSAAANIRPLGVVTAVNGNSVTIRLRGTEGSKTFRVTGDTAVDASSRGRASSLVKGAVVLVQPNYSSSTPTAREIVVLPSSTNFGSP